MSIDKVHRIEPEMRNTELRQARDEVEESLGKHTDFTFLTDFMHKFSYDID